MASCPLRLAKTTVWKISKKGFRHGFVVDFTDSAARDAYLPHPEHAKVGKSLVEAAEGGIEGILVFDYAF
ncbi:Dabb family protein [Brucella cytisi]|uniref:Dabb family protein n=1 Tax=Brucella cytisi TaxID=407152 RepID=UPI00313AD5EE